ncbi:hypothetical protein ACCI51_03050 [Microbulbifer echini]|uniref:Uncharacterized protein n=1 Tax=Microbulbifer echini TaxID=1529067 RepID=A0ABV4NJB3_9GAMM
MSKNKTEKDIRNHPLEPYEQPMVFLFDFDDTVIEKLNKLRINSQKGSFGAAVNVNNKQHEKKYLKLNNDYPENLHEFDIVMLDLTNSHSKNYVSSQHQLTGLSGNSAHALLSTYPEQVFDPRPLSINIVSEHLSDIFDKKSFVIAFCGKENIADYQFVEITEHGAKITGHEKVSNFTIYKDFPRYKSRNGKKVKLPEQESTLSPLFLKHLKNINFETIFHHPTVWKDGKPKLANNFFPLLVNERDEIVSYAHFIEESIVLIFPDIKDKPNFVSELFKSYLPEIKPEIFPFHGEFKWLNSGDYPLPGETELLQERVKLEEKFNQDIAENEKQLDSLKVKYKFLSDLITETGEALVSSVEEYLKWLGFESVINLDDTNPDLLEEDIQVDCKDRFLIVEIKGIGGTSTDKDCSQISKIKYRRAEQRGKFDVFGLYIVNHQRYFPPKARTNPPFTKDQIKDADHDSRGLITTYDLYKAYFLIEKGILQKSEVRESLFKTGLITLEPKGITSIGVPHELFSNGLVAIVNLNNTEIVVGDILIVKSQGEYTNAMILSLHVDDKQVNSCKSGEVGIKLDQKLRRNSELFVKTMSTLDINGFEDKKLDVDMCLSTS